MAHSVIMVLHATSGAANRNPTVSAGGVLHIHAGISPGCDVPIVMAK